jgi:hypothetical protein
VRRFRRAAAAVVTVTVAGVLAWATNAAPAFAAQQRICGNGGSGYCMNDWNNQTAGYPVLMYYGGDPNENFSYQKIDRCDGHNYVTAPSAGIGTTYCPFASQSIDAAYAGAPIVQLRYGSTNLCVAANTANGHGVMGDCNSVSTGTGGATGTVQIEDLNYGNLINLYYTNQLGSNSFTYDGLSSGGNPEQPLYMNSDEGNLTVWGGL